MARTSPQRRDDDEPGDEVVEAIGLLTEALETTERARGHLYSFHQLTGTADFKLGDAAERLHGLGYDELADHIETELVGRNVIDGRWTYQIVEEYDDTYWSALRAVDERARVELTGGRRHLHEAALKRRRRTPGHPHHTAGPEQGDRPVP